MATPTSGDAPLYPAFHLRPDGQVVPLPPTDPGTGDHWSLEAAKTGFLAQEQLHPTRKHLVAIHPVDDAAKTHLRARGMDVSAYVPWIPSHPWGDSSQPGHLGERLVFLAVVADSVPDYRDADDLNGKFLREVEALLTRDWARESRAKFEEEFRRFGSEVQRPLAQINIAGFWAGPGRRTPALAADRHTLWQFPCSRPNLQKRFEQGGWLPWKLRERAERLGEGDDAKAVQAEIERGLLLFDDVLTTGERAGWILEHEDALTGLSRRIGECQAELEQADIIRDVGLSHGGPKSKATKKHGKATSGKKHKGKQKPKKSPKTTKTDTAPARDTDTAPDRRPTTPPLTAGASGHAEAAGPPAPFKPWSWARDNGIPDFPAPRGRPEPDLQWWDGYPALVSVGHARPDARQWSARDQRTSRGNLAYHALRHGASGTVNDYAETVGARLATIAGQGLQGVRHALYGRESSSGLRYLVDGWVVLTTDTHAPAARRVITAYPLRHNPDRPVWRCPAEAISWPEEQQLEYALLGSLR